MRILLAMILMLLLAACHRPPDEQRIRDNITAMQSAMQQRQPRQFMDYVATNFTGQEGQLDHDGLHNLLRALALRNETIGVTLGPINVEMQGERATVQVSATFTGGSGGWLPERGAIYAITSGWRREGGEWKCFNASWEQKL